MMDNREIKRLAVVPAYNEADSVASVVDSLRLHAPDFHVLVIDDGSTDETADRARAAGAPVVRMPFNVGIGGAVQTGFIYAKEHGYDYMAQVDGDGQHEASELQKLLQAMAASPDVDVVCGSRFLVDEPGYRATRARRVGIRLFAFALTRMSGRRVTDPSSGFRLYNRRAIELFARDYPHDYPEVEAVLMVHAHRLQIAEVPVRMRGRIAGRSSIDRRQSVYYMIKVSLALLAGIMRRRVVVEPGEPASVSTSH